MEIEIISTSAISNMDSTIEFGLILKHIQSNIHMVHWFKTDYNVHKVLGNLYDDIDPLFDKLQEEIIGTVRQTNAIFPSFTYPKLGRNESRDFNEDETNIMDTYVESYLVLVQILTSIEFNNYMTQVKSGLNNTVEKIFSTFNKANYLLSLISIK